MTTRARSAGRVASRIYALATILYLDANHFTAKFPDESLLVVNPTGPIVPRGRAKTEALARARQLPAHSPGPPLRLQPLRRHARNLRQGHVWTPPRLKPTTDGPNRHTTLRRSATMAGTSAVRSLPQSFHQGRGNGGGETK